MEILMYVMVPILSQEYAYVWPVCKHVLSQLRSFENYLFKLEFICGFLAKTSEC